MNNGKEGGFTLIELVMTMTIMGMISIMVGRMVISGVNLFNTAQSVSAMDWHATLALDMLKNDIHQIRSADDIGTVALTEFSFVNQAGNTIQYRLSGASLLRNNITLATGIQEFQIYYF